MQAPKTNAKLYINQCNHNNRQCLKTVRVSSISCHRPDCLYECKK